MSVMCACPCSPMAKESSNVCKHSFHATWIDLWFNSHSNCPVCRASVARPSSTASKRPNYGSSASRNDDLHQGLPDASSLV